MSNVHFKDKTVLVAVSLKVCKQDMYDMQKKTGKPVPAMQVSYDVKGKDIEKIIVEVRK